MVVAGIEDAMTLSRARHVQKRIQRIEHAVES